MLSKINNFLRKNKKIIFSLTFVLLFLFPLFLGENVTFATGDPSEGFFDNSGLTEYGKSQIIGFVNFLLLIVSTFAGIAAYLVAVFLSPEWTSGAFFGITSYLKNIWVLVSNMVYFIFAFILIFIAFMNIVSAGGENYQLKQSLPRFIVGILIVPFSWFIVNFTISLVGVLTMASLALPFSTFEYYTNTMGGVEIPKHCELDLGSVGKTDKENKNPPYHCSETKTPVTELIKDGNSTIAMFGLTGVYTYGVIGLENAFKIREELISSKVKTVFDLLVKVVFDALFIIIYCILMVALGFVLVVRGIRLWIFMALSPVFGLLYFFKKGSGGGETFKNFNIKQFFALAFVPVYATLALSFGLLFLFIVGRGISGIGETGFFGFGTDTIGEDAVIFVGESKDNNASELVLKGAASDFKNTTGLLSVVGGNSLGILGSLIMKIFGLVVLWMAFMAAFRTSDITKKVAEPFEQFGDQVGKLMTSAPKYVPIFGGQSMASMNQIVSRYQGDLQTRASSKANKFHEKYDFLNTQGGINSEFTKIYQRSNQMIDKKDVEETLNMIKDTIRNKGDLNNPQIIRAFENISKSSIDGIKGLQESITKALENGLELPEYYKIMGEANRNPYIEISGAKSGSGSIQNILNESMRENAKKYADSDNDSSGKTDTTNNKTADVDEKTTKLQQTLKTDITINNLEGQVFQKLNSKNIIEGLDLSAVFDQGEILKLTEGEFKEALEKANLGDGQIKELVKKIKDTNEWGFADSNSN